jgi:hypothetical protein
MHDVTALNFLVDVTQNAPGSVIYRHILERSFPKLKCFTWVPPDCTAEEDHLIEFLHNHRQLETVRIRFPVRDNLVNLSDDNLLDLPRLRVFEGAFSLLKTMGTVAENLTQLRLHVQSWNPELQQLVQSARSLDNLDIIILDDMEALDILGDIASFQLALVSLRITQRHYHRRSNVGVIFSGTFEGSNEHRLV